MPVCSSSCCFLNFTGLKQYWHLFSTAEHPVCVCSPYGSSCKLWEEGKSAPGQRFWTQHTVPSALSCSSSSFPTSRCFQCLKMLRIWECILCAYSVNELFWTWVHCLLSAAGATCFVFFLSPFLLSLTDKKYLCSFHQPPTLVNTEESGFL